MKKTRDRILETSLMLFNSEGESNVTTVDIANEMEISPGNLYYHFKGKEVIIEELFDQFDAEMNSILNAPIDKVIDVKDSWFYLYVVLEQIYSYRFFYFNLSDIFQRYEKIQRRFKRIIKLKHSTTKSICLNLEKNSVIVFSGEDDRDAFVNQVVMTVIYWISFNILNEKTYKRPELMMHHGVFQIMSLVAPHLTPEKRLFFDECKLLYRDILSSIDQEGM